tara:strand:+ start:252 stop:437 length:186 start_codon:yes stop_codon:yes gene_type:complete
MFFEGGGKKFDFHWWPVQPRQYGCSDVQMQNVDQLNFAMLGLIGHSYQLQGTNRNKNPIQE